MLSFIKGFVLGSLVTCGALIGYTYTHHIVRTTDGIKCVSKVQSSFDKIYVDTRAWGAVDYVTNRDVLEALSRAGFEQSRRQGQQALEDTRGALEKALADAKREMDERLKAAR